MVKPRNGPVGGNNVCDFRGQQQQQRGGMNRRVMIFMTRSEACFVAQNKPLMVYIY